VDVLTFSEIQTTVSFGLILRIAELGMNPWCFGRLVRVQTKVFFGLPSIDGKRDVSGMNLLLFSFFRLNQPIGVFLMYDVFGSEWLWEVFQRPIGVSSV